MRTFTYLFLIGVFGTLGFMLSPVLGLVGAGAGFVSATGIFWAYDNATNGGEAAAIGTWISGGDSSSVGSIYDFSNFDAQDGGAGASGGGE